MGEGRPQGQPVAKGLRTIFFYFKTTRNDPHACKLKIICYYADMFKSIPFSIRKVEATEARLQAIYDAAALGLKGDSLALAAGMRPEEYRRLCEFDHVAVLAEQKGRADSEMEASAHLRTAARAGDSKAALAILQHSHGWVAKQSISIDVDQRISILGALRQAESRVIDVLAHEPSPHLEQETHAEHHLQR